MSIKEKSNLIDKIAFGIICAGIFLFSLMFPILNSAAVIIVMALFVCYRLIVNKGMAFDWRLGFLLLAVLPMAIVDFHAGELYSFTYGTIWCLAFLTGKFLITDRHDDSHVYIPVFAMAAGLFIQGLLNYYNCYYYTIKNDTEFGKPGWPEFWTEIETSRSLYAFDFISLAALLIIGILLFNRNKVLSITLIVLNFVAVFCDFALGEGRFILCIQVVTVFLVGALYFIKNHTSISQRTKKVLKIVLAVFTALVVVALVLVATNAFGLHDMYEDSFLARDGGIFGNIRFQSIKEGLQLVFAEPMGGWDVPSIWGGAPHNVWLLFAREYDSVIFAILLAFLVLTIKDFVSLIRKKDLVIADYMLISIFFAINVYYMLETGPWRYRNYWFFILLIDGILRGRVEKRD